MEQIRVGILGFGNLGRGAAAAVSQSPDMALAGIFTRRPPEQVAAEAGGMPVCPAALLEEDGPPVDVLLLCGAAPGISPGRAPGTPGASTSWTASTPTPAHRSTLPPWTPPPGGAAGRR